MLKSDRIRPVIAFVSNSCWSLFNFRLDLIRQFMQDGYVVLAIAPRDEHTEKLLSSTSKVGPSKVGALIYKEIQFQNSAIDPAADWKLYQQLLKIYKDEMPDLIFHYVTKPVIYGSLAAGKLGIPSIAVITGLGYVYSKENILNKIVSFLFRWSLRKSKKVWFLNKENASYFEKKKIIPKQKIKILPGEGIDTGRFTPRLSSPQSTFTFIMISRLLWSKGIGLYTEAASKLKTKGVEARFLMLGKPELMHPDAVKMEIVNEWERAGWIEYLGQSDNVPEFLSKADCFVLPTFYEEGVPRSIMEAASMELPVIASRHIGCDLVVKDGVTGYLCNPQDAQDLSANMERIMTLTSEQRTEMGKKGRELMKAVFDKELVTSIYQETVREFLS